MHQGMQGPIRDEILLHEVAATLLVSIVARKVMQLPSVEWPRWTKVNAHVSRVARKAISPETAPTR